ncbi:formylglycine-generating enzyme family protein [Aquincola tertiaricarbonis]|uniref:formylglycine-generating enzyme family protein n=1 Tax=Aquincola tertiaricarbonis TaxID=391953 RepID=UPI000696A54C
MVAAACVLAAGAVAGLGGCAGPLPAATNSLGMQFVRLPAGEFRMGSDEPAESLARSYPQLPARRFGLLDDEAPVHVVRITRPFEMGRHEVTVGQWRRFLALSGHVPESVADGSGGYGYSAAYDPAGSARGDAFEGRSPRYSWRDPGFPQTEDDPVVNITWGDAMALAQWLSRTEQRRYRLPTEAEWEYACRAGSRGRYGNGDDPANLRGAANLFDADALPPWRERWPDWVPQAAPWHDGFAFTAPVGRFAPNAFGLHDMHGNVWEWTADWYGERYYAESPRDDPTGPPDGEVKVRRGGSWHSWPFYARCSYRNWNSVATRYTLVGMRLVRDVAD